MVLVYNATGATLSLADDGQDWTGSVYSSPISDTFHNGQWIAFLHVKPAALALGSQAARVFRGRDVDGRTRDFVVAWYIPWDNISTRVRTSQLFLYYKGMYSMYRVERQQNGSPNTRDN
jgi:hypothetical protein